MLLLWCSCCSGRAASHLQLRWDLLLYRSQSRAGESATGELKMLVPSCVMETAKLVWSYLSPDYSGVKMGAVGFWGWVQRQSNFPVTFVIHSAEGFFVWFPVMNICMPPPEQYTEVGWEDHIGSLRIQVYQVSEAYDRAGWQENSSSLSSLALLMRSFWVQFLSRISESVEYSCALTCFLDNN